MTVEDPAETPALLAAELAFGLLDADERRIAEAHRARDLDFDQSCEQWEERVATLLDGADVVPGPGLWNRILSRIAVNDQTELVSLHRSIHRWRAATVALGVIAGALGGALVSERQHARPEPASFRAAPAIPIIVILTSANRQAIVSVSFDPASRRYIVANDAFRAGRHSAELWVIPSDQAPRSLGLLAATPRTSRIAPEEGASWISPGAMLAISLEPIGGSKTGKPTGPVVLTGRV